MKKQNTNENTFVKKVSYNSKSPLDSMRTFAIKNHIPIIGDEVLRFLELILSVKKPKNILEVGTAIGYSSAAMLLSTEANLTTIEKNHELYRKANENLISLDLKNRVNIILGDASDVLKELAEDNKKFDFVFIDASKAHYLEHFKIIEPMLDEEALILFDNIMYLGLLAGRRSISRNNTIRYRMQELIDYCFNNENYKTSLLQAEDGLLVLYKLVSSRA